MSNILRIALCILVAGLTVVLPEMLAAQAQTKSPIGEASNRATELFNAGKYGEAVPIALRALTLTKAKYPPGHAEVIQATHNLAMIYRFNDQSAEAEKLFRENLAINEKKNGPRHKETGLSVLNVAETLRDQGKYGEAETFYKRAIANLEKSLGPEHPDLGAAVGGLASLYQTQMRYDAAEPLRERALAIDERATPRDNRSLAISLANLASVYVHRGRYEEAETNYLRSVALIEKSLGPTHPELGSLLVQFSALYNIRGDHAKAIETALRALSIKEKALGIDHPDLVGALGNLGNFYDDVDQPKEAELALKRALSILERFAKSRPDQVATALNNLALSYHKHGRAADAEPLYQRSLAIAETTFGVSSPAVATTLNNLASLYKDSGRYQEAVAIYKRALEIFETNYGPKHINVATVCNNIASIYENDAQHEKALPYAKRALDIREELLGPKHLDVAASLRRLGNLYTHLKRFDEAEKLLLRGFEIFETTVPPDSAQLIEPLKIMGAFYRDRGDLDRALTLQLRALDIVERRAGRGDKELADMLDNIGLTYYRQKNWERSLSYSQRATEITLQNERRQSQAFKNLGTGKSIVQATSEKTIYQFIVMAGYRVAQADPSRAAELQSSMFIAAQRGLVSEAARALAQMSNRNSGSQPELAQRLRERQDLTVEWHVLDRKLIAARGGAAADRNSQGEAAIASRQRAIDTRIAEIDKGLDRDFPDSAASDGQEPLTIEEVQSWLRDGEVLVLPFSTFEFSDGETGETFVWAITKTDVVWKRAAIGVLGVAKHVNALRCGVDVSAWEKPLCAKLLNTTYTEADAAAGKPLPFDLKRAHELYAAIFGEIETFIGSKQLLVVPSFVLARFPLHALVIRPPASDGPEAYREAAWFGKRNAISVLPAVSSLKALRRNAKASRAGNLYIGFGNPLLDGPDQRYASSAQLAREKAACPAAPLRVAAAKIDRRAAPMVSDKDRMDPNNLRTLFSPLPETADELCDVARTLGVPTSDIFLGSAANERGIKAMSRSGKLTNYQILHFATHGALGGQVKVGVEPGLILTPPAAPSEEDDGYLSASEIAALKLDADLVILSACNTASGSQVLLESLTGMAQSFLYAGARALLVSYWEVNSAATVKLITKTVAVMAADKSATKSDALRQAMMSLVEAGDLADAHPAIWAPFVVVGEAAR